MRKQAILVGVCALMICASSFTAWAQTSATIQKTNAAPAIDGSMDDPVWAEATAHPVSEFFPLPPDLYSGPQDLNVTWKALWDDTNLYVFVDVNDDEVVDDFANCDWQNDSIEIYIDSLESDEGDYNTNRDVAAYQFTALAGITEPDAFCEFRLEERDPDGVGNSIFTAGINSYDRDDDGTRWPQQTDISRTVLKSGRTGWTLEAQFPWESLETTPAEVMGNGSLGFGIAINDNDDGIGRDSQLMWGTQRDDLWRNASSIPAVALTTDSVGGGGVLGDFNNNQKLDAEDVDLLAQAVRSASNDSKFDLNKDGKIDSDDHTFWVKDSSVAKTWIGDANLDGEFSSADFVVAFLAGEYETGNPAGWAGGDWDGNGVFQSSDFVAAFLDGGYELGPQPAINAVPEPASFVMIAMGLICLGALRRR